MFSNLMTGECSLRKFFEAIYILGIQMIKMTKFDVNAACAAVAYGAVYDVNAACLLL